MPFIKSGSDDATEENFHEFRHGPRFRSLQRKYGTARARKVMQAAVLSNRRRHGGARHHRHRRGHSKSR